MELSTYARAQIALAKMKIIRARVEIIQAASVESMTEPEGAHLVEMQQDTAQHAATIEEFMSGTMDPQELEMCITALDELTSNLLVWSLNAQRIAPGF